VTPLEEHLRRLIAVEGPLTIGRFMAEVLGHPRWGYYATRDPLGRAGDFITAPEVSQMFGELLGLWSIERWQAMAAPDRLLWVELGPGRGSLTADALRAAGAVAAFGAAIEVHLVETSPTLRAIQERTLADHAPIWHQRLAELPAAPAIFIANEFFDALPVRQWQRTAEGWRERQVGPGDDGLRLVLAPPAPPPEMPAALATAPIDGVVEIAPARQAVMAELAGHIVEHGGAGLIVDYGHAVSAPGDTLQAVKDHRYAPILADPGEADLTAHVDFQALGAAAREAGAQAWPVIEQGAFLRRLGIEARAGMLKAGADAAQAADIDRALHRLTAADQMGSLFKVMAVTVPGDGPPAGFEDAA
jgi:NADH dehydrogenase [ubiquinone] 1 alpha subcomplex assembly factor 7